MEHARRYHRDGIDRHFSQHLPDDDVEALTHALEKIIEHARATHPHCIEQAELCASESYLDPNAYVLDG